MRPCCGQAYRVTNCTEAISYTEAPETLRMFPEAAVSLEFWGDAELLETS
jgi:hypothetical protein